MKSITKFGTLLYVDEEGNVYNDKLNRVATSVRDEYLAFHLKKGKNQYTKLYVHNVVAEAFHGPKPADNYLVDHIDCNKLNNRPDNLEWVTRSENARRSAQAEKDGRKQSFNKYDMIQIVGALSFYNQNVDIAVVSGLTGVTQIDLRRMYEIVKATTISQSGISQLLDKS